MKSKKVGASTNGRVVVAGAIFHFAFLILLAILLLWVLPTFEKPQIRICSHLKRLHFGIPTDTSAFLIPQDSLGFLVTSCRSLQSSWKLPELDFHRAHSRKLTIVRSPCWTCGCNPRSRMASPGLGYRSRSARFSSSRKKQQGGYGNDQKQGRNAGEEYVERLSIIRSM